MNMISGLFRGHPINQRPSKKQSELVLAEFAELLSRNWELKDIASQMEMSVGSACAWLRILRETMGEQAI